MSSMFERERLVLEKTVRDAGREVMRISRQGFETTFKANDSPLTTADLAANSILMNALHEAFPNDGFLSEETADDRDRLGRSRVWIIDPIDGTKEFVRGLPEYSISVALVIDGVPQIGIVFNPVTDEYFEAVSGQGSQLNGKPTRVRERPTQPPTILCSRSEWQRDQLSLQTADIDIRPIGSIAYKLALVSAGLADGTFSPGPKNEWDIAAGVLLVKESGGVITDGQGRPFQFNKNDTLNQGVIAASPASWKALSVFFTRFQETEN